jgi:uncharacterized membrane protein YeiH
MRWDSSNFQKEIYATICILGGIVFFILRKFNLDNDILYLISSGDYCSSFDGGKI